jgi:hypothetical protein
MLRYSGVALYRIGHPRVGDQNKASYAVPGDDAMLLAPHMSISIFILDDLSLYIYIYIYIYIICSISSYKVFTSFFTNFFTNLQFFYTSYLSIASPS